VLSAVIATAEPSKVPFYIVGGVLVLWAVALAWIGLSRPAFPNGARGQLGVTVISLALVVAAIAMAIVTA